MFIIMFVYYRVWCFPRVLLLVLNPGEASQGLQTTEAESEAAEGSILLMSSIYWILQCTGTASFTPTHTHTHGRTHTYPHTGARTKDEARSQRYRSLPWILLHGRDTVSNRNVWWRSERVLILNSKFNSNSKHGVWTAIEEQNSSCAGLRWNAERR